MNSAELDARRDQLARITAVVYQSFGHKISEQEMDRFLKNGTFCPGATAPIGKQDVQRKRGEKYP